MEVFGGPASVVVEVDKGLEGERSGYILSGVGSPEEWDFPVINGIETTPRFLDWYLNLGLGDPEYMSMYQLKETGWDKIFKIVPNVYSDTREANFVNGALSLSLVFPITRLALNQLPEYKEIPSSALTVANEAAMLASSRSLGQYVYRSDISQFFVMTAEPSTALSSWTPGAAISLSIDVQTLYPVALSVKAGKPTKNSTNYTFPIVLSAATANPTSGWQALSGLNLLHTTITVV
jgi:hypothetical protein